MADCDEEKEGISDVIKYFSADVGGSAVLKPDDSATKVCVRGIETGEVGIENLGDYCVSWHCQIRPYIIVFQFIAEHVGNISKELVVC